MTKLYTKLEKLMEISYCIILDILLYANTIKKYIYLSLISY